MKGKDKERGQKEGKEPKRHNFLGDEGKCIEEWHLLIVFNCCSKKTSL